MSGDILATIAAALADVGGLLVTAGHPDTVVIQQGETRYVISVIDERSIAPDETPEEEAPPDGD